MDRFNKKKKNMKEIIFYKSYLEYKPILKEI
jgi:hypothetical protein